MRGKKEKCGVIVVYLLVIRIAFFPHFLLRQRKILLRYDTAVINVTRSLCIPFLPTEASSEAPQEKANKTMSKFLHAIKSNPL